MSRVKYYTELNKKDFKEFSKAVKKLGSIPKSALNAATKKQAVKLKKAIKDSPLMPKGTEGSRVSDISDAIVPASTKLEKGLKIAREKKSKRGKSVQQIRFAEEKSFIFVRLYDQKRKRAYYPASMEYGFKRNGIKVFQGKYFLRKTAEEKSYELKKSFIDEATKNIKNIWLKKNGKWK
jgi:hypothetical protein